MWVSQFTCVEVRGQLAPTMWVPEIKLRSSGLVEALLPAKPSPWPLNFSFFLWKIRVSSLVLVNLTQTEVAWEKEISNEPFPSSDWPVGLSGGRFLA